MSKYDELERLARLKEQGILSEEEFQAQKKKLLEEPHTPAHRPAGTGDEKRKPNIPLIIILILAPITIALALWIVKSGDNEQESTGREIVDSLLTDTVRSADTVQPPPSADLTSPVVDAAVEDAMIRQIRRSELEGIHMRKGDKLQVERGDLDRDGDEDIAVLFSLINTGTDTFIEYLVVFTNDGTGRLRFAADRTAGVDDQAQGSSWDLKGIANEKMLVAIREWGDVENSDGISEQRETSTVREFRLSGGRIADVP